MKFFSYCLGECCVCGCGTGCIAGHGDDFYYEATIEQVVERLNTGRYPAYRQYMIDWLCNKGYKFNEGYAHGLKTKRPQGEWIKEYKDFKCSLCGKIAYSWNNHGTYIQIKSDFCPHCGADMRGGTEWKEDING